MLRRAQMWTTPIIACISCCIGFAGLAAESAAAPPPDLPAGSLDVDFGDRGIVLTELEGFSAGEGLALQEDGKIVVAGVSDELGPNNAFGIVRYRPDGALDPTFGAAGKVTAPLRASAFAVALQRDGKIVAAGGTTSSGLIAVARYRRDGQLDDTFGTAGVATADAGAGMSAGALALAIQTDGRIVVAGNVAISGSRGLIVRFDRDGSLDGTFGAGGRVISDLGGAFLQTLEAVVVEANGKIVVAGFNKAPFLGTVARFHSDGSPDATFGTGGFVATDLGSQAFFTTIAVQRDGKIVVGGMRASDPTSSPNTATVARFWPDGTPDATFGTGGAVFTSIPGSDSFIRSIKLDRCGRIVAAGLVAFLDPSPGAALLVRYDPHGAVDPTFGNAGTVLTARNGVDLGATGVAIARDGDILAAGTATDATGVASFMLARYEGGHDRGQECRGADEGLGTDRLD
jgi:uncharacterized delta-60 repeat protein